MVLPAIVLLVMTLFDRSRDLEQTSRGRLLAPAGSADLAQPLRQGDQQLPALGVEIQSSQLMD